MENNINPIIKLDYPDADVIRVEDTYYMVSTTMHFMPGCEILRSYDLVHWEHAAYVYDRLDSTPGQRLLENQSIYGKGSIFTISLDQRMLTNEELTKVMKEKETEEKLKSALEAYTESFLDTRIQK